MITQMTRNVVNFVLGTLLFGGKFLYSLCMNGSQWKRVIFAANYTIIQPWLQYSNQTTKTRLFSELRKIESKSPSLRNRGPGVLRILEIGIGPSANFGFYPKGCHLITLDPNVFFEDAMKESVKKNPHLVYEKHIVGFGENMSEISDSSVDVVVGTYLLCSVSEPQKVLDEIHRVLVPGGKYFFMEHVSFENSLGRWLQIIQHPFWSPFVDNCKFTRRSYKEIQKSSLQVEHREFRTNYIIPFPFWPHVEGVAKKIS